MHPELNSNPVRFYTAMGDSIVLNGCMAGKGPETSAFLVASGPSLRKVDLRQLEQRGIFSMAINNAWSMFRPTAWTFSDSVGSFIEQGWFDPGIMKFVPAPQKEGRIVRKVEGEFKELDWRAWQMPNCWFYNRDSQFDHKTFLTSTTVNWGQDDGKEDALGLKGGRSTLLAGFRLLTVLGFTRIYLLGVDFEMGGENGNYAFEQERTPQSIKGNNQTYEILHRRFDALKPELERFGIKVYNCNPDSKLKTFEFLDYNEAVQQATENCLASGIDTSGRYDRSIKPVTRSGRRQHELKKYKKLAAQDPKYGATNHGAAAVPLIKSWAPKRVLDCGCGRNLLVQELRLAGIEALGVDFAFPEADFQAPLHALPFRDGAFDVITAFDVLEHVLPEDVELVLDEFRRVATKGKFCFSICYRPSRKTVDGENLHPTVREESWWIRRIQRVARTIDSTGRYLHGDFK